MSEATQMIRYLDGDQVEAVGADMNLALEAVEEVFRMHARNEVNLPSKVVLDMDERRHGRVNAMPAYLGGSFHICGLKWIAGFPNNPRKYGIARAHALIILNNADTGLPVAIIEGSRISALRTGAVTGIGGRYLARRDSQTLALIGAGVQAWTQFEAMQTVLERLTETRIFDIDRKKAESMQTRAASRWPDLKVSVADSPEEAITDADCVITATVADEPIVKAAWLKEGVFFAHVGSYQEEEEAVIQKADKVVVDLWEEVLHRRTPLLARMFEQGKIDASRIYADLGNIVEGRIPGRENNRERIFFSPLGLGSEDIALAARIFQRATASGLGTLLPFGQ
jgi:ornithine cyclodeaminase